MSVLLSILGIVLFVLGVLISVALHELGHMIPAKAFGMKVTQFFVGFGRTVWSVK
ncbi:MAG: zinc metalloprotease, partial [Kribbellaceae bacterium]|nr:zinc metalloprotease [Kribbellaceae bacterium]